MINYANNDVIVAPDGKWLEFNWAPEYPEYRLELYNNTVDKQVEICGMNVRPSIGYYFGRPTSGTLPGRFQDQMISTDNPFTFTMGPTVCYRIAIVFPSDRFTTPIDAITWYESFTQEGLVEGGFDSANLYGVISYGNDVLLSSMGPITNAVNVQRSMAI